MADKAKSDPIGDFDVIIIGGGLVGGPLAVALAGAGATVAVIEQGVPDVQLDAAFDGRASAIASASQAVLAAVGLWKTIEPEAQPILDIRVTDGHSPLFVHYDHGELGLGPLGYMVENRTIRRAVFAGLDALDGVTLLTGRCLDELTRDAAWATALLNDGTSVRGRLAVAADGRNSPTRRGAGIAVTEWRYPQTSIVCTVANKQPHHGVAREHFLPAGPFAILPMTGQRSSIVWTERNRLVEKFLALDEDAFNRELAMRIGDYLGTTQVIGPRFSYAVGLMHAETYTAPRLALAGDAAHGMHPIAGQGLNIGLRDVAALAEIVVDALRLGLDPGAMIQLDRYQRWRRFDNTLMLALTDGLNRLFSNNIAAISLARDGGLGVVNRIAPLKKMFMLHAMGLVGDLPRLARGERL